MGITKIKASYFHDWDWYPHEITPSLSEAEWLTNKAMKEAAAYVLDDFVNSDPISLTTTSRGRLKLCLFYGEDFVGRDVSLEKLLIREIDDFSKKGSEENRLVRKKLREFLKAYSELEEFSPINTISR